MENSNASGHIISGVLAYSFWQQEKRKKSEGLQHVHNNDIP
jgi:hypothetical protein